jgi:hypothetical protein
MSNSARGPPTLRGEDGDGSATVASCESVASGMECQEFVDPPTGSRAFPLPVRGSARRCFALMKTDPYAFPSARLSRESTDQPLAAGESSFWDITGQRREGWRGFQLHPEVLLGFLACYD